MNKPAGFRQVTISARVDLSRPGPQGASRTWYTSGGAEELTAPVDRRAHAALGWLGRSACVPLVKGDAGADDGHPGGVR